MDSITLKAPAKINLFLKVLAKREDGYHTIETLFEKIALFDKIKLKKADKGISIHSDNKGLPKDKENLAYRAARLLEDKCETPLGVRIEIEKSIPIGAGLGGGSSDAAAVLVGINRLYNKGLSTEELEGLAREIGADVPFFLSNKSWAVGRDRGDKIEEIDSRMRLWHVLIIPPFPILSKEAYKWVDRVASKKVNQGVEAAVSSVKKNDIQMLGRNLYNDLEGISLEKERRLKDLKNRLLEYGAKGAMITGSGPVLFGILDEEKEVVSLKGKIEEELEKDENGWQVLLAPTFYNEQGGE